MDDIMQIFAATADADLATTLKRMLKGMTSVRTDFHHSGNADASLRLASFFGPHVMFVDARLQGYRSLIAQVRAENPGTMVVLITATGGKRAPGAALGCGARDCLARDAVDREALDRCVWRALAAWAEKRRTLQPSLIGQRPVERAAWNWS